MATILSIDDYPANRQVVHYLLSSAGHTVVEAEDSAQAWERLRICHPDLIICDLVLPDKTGYELVKRIRAAAEFAQIPILVISAVLTDQSAASLARSLGADHYLTKPFDPTEFLDIVAQMLTSRRSPVSAVQQGQPQKEEMLVVGQALWRKSRELDETWSRLRGLTQPGTLGHPTLMRPILLVEDDPMDVDRTRQAFEQNSVANPLVICRDGEEAIQFIDSHLTADDPQFPLLVLLDLRLPKVDGIDVLAHARQQPAWSQVPIVVVTTSSENTDIARANERGANSYLVKPVEFASFCEVVKNTKIYWLLTNEPERQEK